MLLLYAKLSAGLCICMWFHVILSIQANVIRVPSIKFFIFGVLHYHCCYCIIPVAYSNTYSRESESISLIDECEEKISFVIHPIPIEKSIKFASDCAYTQTSASVSHKIPPCVEQYQIVSYRRLWMAYTAYQLYPINEIARENEIYEIDHNWI